MSSRDLDELRPEIRPMVDAFVAAVKAAGIDMIVTCTYRSPEEQAAEFAKGRDAVGNVINEHLITTKARPGQSAHNYGLALDVVPIANGKCVWSVNDPLWQRIGALGVAAGLQWYGSPGEPFKEFPHFQHPAWKLLIQQGTA